MLLCLHVEFVFMLMPFTWLTDDLLKDNPPSKLRLSISAAQICLFCEKYENPRTLGIVRTCADKSLLCCLGINLPIVGSSPCSGIVEFASHRLPSKKKSDRAFHKLLGNFLAISRISSNFLHSEQFL